jgi:serine/threonine protein kinase
MDLLHRLAPIARRFCDPSKGLWQFECPIRPGGSAALYRIRDNAHTAALKIYDPKLLEGKNGAVERRRIQQQRDLIGHDCPTLVEHIDAGEFENTAYVIMEYVPWDTLTDVVTKVPRSAIRTIISQVAAAAKYLDDRGLCHRDIKPDNIAISLDWSCAKLLDLGVIRSLDDRGAVRTDDGDKLPFVATAQYSSPEYLFRLEPVGERLWRGLTFYQLGGVLHDLIMRKPLFQDFAARDNRYVMAYAVANQTPVVLSEMVDTALILLARDCLGKDLSRRLELVNWARFEGDQSARLAAARERLGLRKLSPKPTPHYANEHHRHRLQQAAKSLRNVVDSIFAEECFPAATRTVVPKDFTNVALEVSIGPPALLRGPSEVRFTFELGAPIGSASADIRFGSGSVLVGSTNLDDPETDVDLLRVRLTELLILEYESATTSSYKPES